MENDITPGLPRYYEYSTNGSNDTAQALLEFDRLEEIIKETWKLFPAADQTSRRSVRDFCQVLQDTRNERMLKAEDLWKQANSFALQRCLTCEPLFTGRCYELICDWIPKQELIIGCQYEISDLHILRLLDNTPSLRLILDGGTWLSSTANKAINARYWLRKKDWGTALLHASKEGVEIDFIDSIDLQNFLKKHYPKALLSSIHVYRKTNEYDHMHQKWLMGVGSRFNQATGQNQVTASLIYGSYNISNNAKSNIESALYFPVISEAFANALFDEYANLLLRNNVISLGDWINENGIV